MDGYNITSLLCAFFITHLPEIIRQGRLYKSVTPLYRIKSKYKEFILNKQEYVRIYEKQVRDNLTIVNPDTKKVYSDIELQDILMHNRSYLDMLTKLSNHLVVNPVILEYILIHRHDKNFIKEFHKKFPELTIDDSNVMTGIYDGKYQILIMDYLFEKRIKDIEKFIKDVNAGTMYFNVYEKSSDGQIDKGKMTLGQFLTECQKFQPIIKTRYKGVGELNANDLRDNALDPSNRILIRLTINDIERDLSQFNILHGNDSDERAAMMKHFKINSDDLDN